MFGGTPMKKFTCVFLTLLLLFSCLPIVGGAGAVLYTPDKSAVWTLKNVNGTTFAGDSEAIFTAEGVGTVTIPETTVSAMGGDGVRVRILKEGVEAVPYTDVAGGETVTLPAVELHVVTGDEITFECDDRAVAGDSAEWGITIAYTGGIAEAEALVNFIDLNGHWAKPYVVPLAEAGLIKGKTTNRFDPDGQITRAEFLTLALNVADLPAMLYQPSYADVSEEQWFSKVAYTAKRGEIPAPEMIQDNKLLPDQPILREEMAAVIIRLVDVMRGRTIDKHHSFPDVTPLDWANVYIGKAANLGIVTGNPDGTFLAKATATRAEAAVMFSRLKKYLDETEAYTPAGEYSPVYDAFVYEGVDLNQKINAAYMSGHSEITIAPGAYRLKATPKGGHIYLEGVKNFTINGEGVIILMQTNATSAFALRDCENVTINGFSTDHDKRVMFQGEIYNIDPDGFYFDVAIDPGHQIESKRLIQKGMMGAIYSRETGCIVEGTSTVTIEPKQIEQLSSNTFRINGKKTAGQPNVKVGDSVGAWGQSVSPSYSMKGCKNITIKNVNIWGGMCVITDVDGEGDNKFQNIQTTYGPRPLGAVTDRVVAVHGDGLHTTANRVGPKMDNCTFEHLLDDGTNIHGHFGKVAGIEGDKVIIGVSGGQQLYWAGDDLRFYSPDTIENSALLVKTCEQLSSYTPQIDLVQGMGSATFRPEKYFAVTLEKGDRNFKVGDWVINRNWTSSGYWFKNCTFRDTRSRALLIKSSDGLIENCTISNGAGYGLWIAPEFDWMESGYSENVIIRNCTFHSSGWIYKHSAGLAISGGEGIGQDHDNITVEGCTFYGNHQNDLWMSEGKNFTIRNNKFLKDTDYNAPITIRLRNIDGVTVSGNTYESGRPTEIVKDETVTNLKMQ